MRARHIMPHQLASLLMWCWSDETIPSDMWWEILSACDLSIYKDDLFRLYQKCIAHSISEQWIEQALVWYLNNI